MTLFCHVGKEVQEFRPLAIQAASTAEVYLAVVSRPSSSRIARIAPNMTEEGLGAVIDKLQRHREVLALEQLNHLLQFVAALAHHADGVALDLRSYFRELVANQLHDLAAEVLRDALLQLESLARVP